MKHVYDFQGAVPGAARVAFGYLEGKPTSVQRLLEKYIDGIGQSKSIFGINGLQVLTNFRVNSHSEHISFCRRNDIHCKYSPFLYCDYSMSHLTCQYLWQQRSYIIPIETEELKGKWFSPLWRLRGELGA